MCVWGGGGGHKHDRKEKSKLGFRGRHTTVIVTVPAVTVKEAISTKPQRVASSRFYGPHHRLLQGVTASATAGGPVRQISVR